MASLSWVTLQEFSLVPQSHRSMELNVFKGHVCKWGSGEVGGVGGGASVCMEIKTFWNHELRHTWQCSIYNCRGASFEQFVTPFT